jgi:triphosphoribosyl-dephospho-CoA synthase
VRTAAQNARLALLLEVAGTPKPGNVDRHREYPDLRFEHFLAGAVGTEAGFEHASTDGAVGASFERAIEGMSHQLGGNTQFGAVLLLTPLVKAAVDSDHLTPEAATAVVDATTVADAVSFYRAFEHVDVAVDEPPEGMGELDVRRGTEAAPYLREQELTLADIMARSAQRDGIAAEWTGGFERTFGAADRLREHQHREDCPVTDSAATVFLELLADRVDTFVQTQHDHETALEVRDRAQSVRAGEKSVESFADELVEREINPGTTADITAGALFVALERGLRV